MSRVNYFMIGILSVLIFLMAAIFIVKNNKRLVKEREDLILKNDSLHSLQLETRKELAYTKARLDSLLNKDKNTIHNKQFEPNGNRNYTGIE